MNGHKYEMETAPIIKNMQEIVINRYCSLNFEHTVDGRNPAPVGEHPIIYRVLYIPGGAGFLLSSVAQVTVPNLFFIVALQPVWQIPI